MMHEKEGNVPGLVLTPESTTQVVHLWNNESVEGRAIVATTVRIPHEVITDVVINPKTRDFLSDLHRPIASNENLLNIVRVTVPHNFFDNSNEYDPKRILTPHSHGRSIPLAYGGVPYAGRLLGQTVDGKGGLINGKYYAISDDHPINVDWHVDPLGFFGNSDAQMELDVSNLLIEAGGRCSLVIGYVVMDPDRLADFIGKTWGRYLPKTTQTLQRGIDIVKGNGD